MASLAPLLQPEADATAARVARVIAYLVEHREEQPTLAAVAGVAGLSPWHLQRAFSRWAGISPKRFLQYVTLGHAKRALAGGASVLDAALDAGLSGPSRLHDLFVACEAMTPGEFKALGDSLVVRYGLHDTPLGRVVIATTTRGVCWLSFVAEDDAAALAAFADAWAGARLLRDDRATAEAARRAFALGERHAAPLPVLLRGTNFQIKVWEALLRVPFGHTVSYAAVARAIGRPTATRAVARAVARNDVAWLIPCHRVIRASGALHNYRWGAERKRLLVATEAALAAAGD